MCSGMISEIPVGVGTVIKAKRVVDDGIESVRARMLTEALDLGHSSSGVAEVPLDHVRGSPPPWKQNHYGKDQSEADREREPVCVVEDLHFGCRGG